jgi:hypothetical protein
MLLLLYLTFLSCVLRQVRALQATGLNADVAATLARALRGGAPSPPRAASPPRNPTFTGAVDWGDDGGGGGGSSGSNAAQPDDFRSQRLHPKAYRHLPTEAGHPGGRPGGGDGAGRTESVGLAEEARRQVRTRVAFAAGNRFASTETVRRRTNSWGEGGSDPF